MRTLAEINAEYSQAALKYGDKKCKKEILDSECYTLFHQMKDLMKEAEALPTHPQPPLPMPLPDPAPHGDAA